GYMLLPASFPGLVRLEGLIEGADGAFYGSGCSSPACIAAPFGGEVFRNKDGSGYSVLHRFQWPSPDPAEGGGPSAIIQASDGALYGTTVSGGDAGLGTVFALRPQPVMLPPIFSGGGAQVRFT